MTSKNNADKNLERWMHWSAIASSIAAIVSLLLFGYQLITDRADLKIGLKGAAFADYPSYKNIYFAVWIKTRESRNFIKNYTSLIRKFNV